MCFCCLQADEIEALTSIYGKEWCVVDAASRVYSIDVEGGEETPRLKIALRVSKFILKTIRVRFYPEYYTSLHYTRTAEI